MKKLLSFATATLFIASMALAQGPTTTKPASTESNTKKECASKKSCCNKDKKSCGEKKSAASTSTTKPAQSTTTPSQTTK
ncbi:MAG: hypothetical protein NTW54_11635 [Bacteroidetes bacterium]|nr:hypothetical protein [Bacteroidota bacterium]